MATDAELAERRRKLLGPLTELTGAELKLEVRNTFANLAFALDSLSPEQAIWGSGGDEWSAAQICDHMALSTGLLGNITSLLAKGQTPEDADWDPPPHFKGNVSDLGDVRRRLGELPAYTDRLYDQGAATDRRDVLANNSFLGDMNWREWFYFLRIHAISHIEQIDNLHAIEGFPP